MERKLNRFDNLLITVVIFQAKNTHLLALYSNGKILLLVFVNYEIFVFFRSSVVQQSMLYLSRLPYGEFMMDNTIY